MTEKRYASFQNGVCSTTISSTELLQKDGWYELDRVPNLLEERVIYDSKTDSAIIVPHGKTPEEQRRIMLRRQIMADLPDIILQNKDNPDALVQALCDRAKQIETGITV